MLSSADKNGVGSAKDSAAHSNMSRELFVIFGLLLTAFAGLLVRQFLRMHRSNRCTAEALQASEARFDAFMNNSPLIAYIKDESGKVVYLNQRFTDLLQRPVSDCLGKTTFEIWPSALADESYRDDLLALRDNRRVESVVSVPGPGGKDITCLTARFPFEMRGRRFLGGVSLDVSELERAEVALRTSNDRFQTAFAHASVGMSVTDPAGRILEVNPAICQILGYSAEELLNFDVLAITHPDDRPATVEWQRRAGNSVVDHVHFQMRYIHKNGTTVWLQVSRGTVRDADGKPTCFIALLEDVTGERRAQDLARVNEERWHLALEATNDGIWDWDATSNEVYYSARWKQMLGFEESELPNHPETWEQLVHPDDLPRAKRAVDQHLRGESPYYSAEYRIRCKDGAYKWVLARGKAMWDDRGRPLRLIGSHTDVTDRKRAEESLLHQASFDTLTGLMNRRYFLASLETKVAAANHIGQALSLCVCDVDRFKSINDRYGHGAGDEVLANLARILQENSRSADVAGRLGGDEFCLVLSGTKASRAVECLERVRDRFQSVVFNATRGELFSATASFGVADLLPGMDSAAFLDAADRALYAAKRIGRNRVASLAELSHGPAGLEFPLLENSVRPREGKRTRRGSEDSRRPHARRIG
jgi:diguanylate cyclase (GGDEF)-like protein/PAS domain S-box-containing protein